MWRNLSSLAPRLASVCVLVGLTGCSAVPYQTFRAFGAKELVAVTFEDVDVAALLSGGELSDKQPGQTDKAFREFEKTNMGTPARRNAIQERILAASEQRCGSYKIFLKQYEGESNFLMGAITTALAGAGALVSPVTAARALSGSAGVMSGVNAEFNDKLFAKLTIQVLTKAIDARRKSIYEQILKNRGSKKDTGGTDGNGDTTTDKDGKGTKAGSLEEYPVEAAIKDALTYHAACSLIVGLEEAGAAIERKGEVGLKQLNDLKNQFPNLNIQFGATATPNK